MNSDGNLVGINTYSVDDLMNVSGAVAVDEVITFLESNDIEVIDFDEDYSIERNSSNLVYNFQTFEPNKLNDTGFSYNTIFESEEALIEFILPGNEDEAQYIGIDLNSDNLYDVILYDVDEDGSFSYWEIDLDNDGDYEWNGDINIDRKKRQYRKFSNKIDLMLIETSTELETLGLVEYE